MTNPQRAPGLRLWLAIAASAAGGLLVMVRRPGFEPFDLLVPLVLGMAALGVVIALQEFGPPRIRQLVRNRAFLIAFTLGLSGFVAVWALMTLE